MAVANSIDSHRDYIAFLVILGHRFVDDARELVADFSPVEVVDCRAFPVFLVLLNVRRGVLLPVMKRFYDRKNHDTLKAPVWLLLCSSSRRSGRDRIKGIDVRGSFGGELLCCLSIVMILLFEFIRQFAEWNFYKSSGEFDHDSVRFDAGYRGVFVFLTVNRLEVIGQCAMIANVALFITSQSSLNPPGCRILNRPSPDRPRIADERAGLPAWPLNAPFAFLGGSVLARAVV